VVLSTKPNGRGESNDRTEVFASSATDSGDNREVLNHFRGNSINTFVTTPGAVLALGPNVRTGQSEYYFLVARHTFSEFVRPDFLAHRVVSRALIYGMKFSQQGVDRRSPLVVT
jgi:hypothetical protein